MASGRVLPAPDPELQDDVIPDAAAYRASGEWDAVLLVDKVTERATSAPNAPAVVDERGMRRFSYGDLDRDSNRVANYLVSAGVQMGDVIAVQLPNWYETVVVDLGALKAGAVLNPMLPIYRAKELRYMLGLTAAKVVFTPGTYRSTDHVRLVQDVVTSLDAPPEHVVVPGPDAEDQFRSWLSRFDDGPCGRTPSAQSVSEIIFTSGTEADPKAIMHTEETANGNIRAVLRSLDMGDDEVVWMPSPIGHSTGFNFGVRIALLTGGVLVLQDVWNATEAVDLIERDRPTYTVAATTFLADVVDAVKRRERDVSSLRIFGCGGAPVPPQLVADAAEVGIPVLRLYGQTEVLLATWNRPTSPMHKKMTTDGLPISGVQLEIRSDEGDVLPPGSEGEIFIKGSGTCVGFYADPVRTAAKFHEGWVATGDLGILDEDGYLTIVGRKSEIIIRGGLNIAPREIEDQLIGIPGVSKVAVIGAPDPRLGEITCACVVLEPGTELDLDTVVTHLRNIGMATYKLPQRLVVVDEIPMTSTGKVQRHLLVNQLER